MASVGLRAFKAQLFQLIDQVMEGEFVTITRHEKAVAVVVPVEAAEIAREAMQARGGSLVGCLRRFPGAVVSRNSSPSRDVLL
jgi:prevent-host-death family protein